MKILSESTWQGAGLLAVSLVLALTANAISQSGIQLTTNYFAVDAEQEDQYQFIEHGEVMELQQSDGYADEQVIFVDARTDAAYAEGHIAGAYQFDHYRMEKYLDSVLPAVSAASRVVVYCNGGECEDSKLVASDLMNQGVDPTRIWVYRGGVTAWREDGLPFEAGERWSNEIVFDTDEE